MLLKPFYHQLPNCFGPDRFYLRKRLKKLEKHINSGKHDESELLAIAAELEKSIQRRRQRTENLPQPEFPDDLPVSQRREEIAGAIQKHQVVIVAGETGSGKTTQIPKICLTAGRGTHGLIGCTQPRRIAARSIASRIAQELNSDIGQHVGFKVRFHDRTSPNAYIKLMTDGILLAELQQDRFLNAYDTIILDEAHERNLNTDFLIGYLKQLLSKRKDLKLIVTSATIDTERFARHFDNAPIISVEGRTYPVEVRYRPIADCQFSIDDFQAEIDKRKSEMDLLPLAILEAADDLARDTNGDILIFLPGEREIRETAEALRKHHPPQTEILPLYARLSAAEQNRVFHPSGKRRIVLATNVAETSLTVPGITAVIDPGLARLNRYSVRGKVQRLHVEKISQASANQRKGRCGRIAPGICVRLYSEEDFLSRAEFTPPEILRTSLAAVILRMLDLGLGDPDRFPFLEKPDHKRFNEGFKNLQELGAVDTKRKLTPLGKQLAKWPIDPRIARMVLAAQEERCLREMLIIAAALSIQDPRERPMDAQQKADQAQAEFRDDKSDFLSFVKLWDFYQEQQKHLSKNKLRSLCRDTFLSFNRMREWQDIHQQLFILIREHGWQENEQPAEYGQLHRALLSGLLSHVAVRDVPAVKDAKKSPPLRQAQGAERGAYLAARGLKIYLFPGSGIFKKKPKWVVAAEFAETTKLYARCVAEVQPEWIEQVAGDLCLRHYLEPHWEQKAGQVAAFEQVTLYGLTLIPRRKVNYGPIAPQTAHEIFLREGLVMGEVRSQAKFYQHNLKLIDDIANLEDKTRSRDILVDEQWLYEFYAQHVPPHIYSTAAFDKWLRSEKPEALKPLFLQRDDLMQRSASGEDFPNALHVQGMALPLHYSFAPGAEDDGVTVDIPVQVLAQLPPEPFEWLVPGFLEEKVTALIRALPKNLRKNFVPAPNYAKDFLCSLLPSPEGRGALLAELSAFLHQRSALNIPADAWDAGKLAPHLLMRFAVKDEDGQTIASGRDLAALQAGWEDESHHHFAELPKQTWERDKVTEWDFGDLPDNIELKQGALTLLGYPALCVEGDEIALRLFDNAVQAEQAHRQGLLALYKLTATAEIRQLRQHVRLNQDICRAYSAVDACEALKNDLIENLLAAVFLAPPLPRREAEFRQRLTDAKAKLFKLASEHLEHLKAVFAEYAQLPPDVFKTGKQPKKQAQDLSDLRSLLAAKPASKDAKDDDIREHLASLIYPGFARDTPLKQFAHLPRYVKAVRLRVERKQRDPAKDAQKAAHVTPFWQQYRAAPPSPAQEEFRWLLEEFRVSIFAQELKTAVPVSAARLEKAWQEVRENAACHDGYPF
jgi:ATP-dependent helicase HrpA